MATLDVGDLEQLCQASLAELAAFQRTRSTTQSSTACETLLRLAIEGHDDALDRLLAISATLVLRNCPPHLGSDREEAVQRVLVRIFKRLRCSPLPFDLRGFAAFRDYLNMTLRSVIVTMHYDRHALESLDALRSHHGYEPPDQQTTEPVEARMRLERCAELIDDPCIQSMFRLRFIMGAGVEETAQALSNAHAVIDKTMVIKQLSAAVRRLARLPEVRDMFEAESSSQFV